MKAHITAIAAVAGAALLAAACTWGTVRDAETGEPIAGAEVRFADSTGHEGKAVTDANGVYVFDASRGDAAPAPGSVTFDLSAPGYRTATAQREVTKAANMGDFTLGRCSTADTSIELTHVPPYGSFERLEGRVSCVVPSDFNVAVFIEVRGGWWTKPYWAQPLTLINPDGSWSCDITTGGVDEEATEIVAFVVPNDYSPPLMRGQRSLPAELWDEAADEVTVQRTPEL
jgi:hypothetical protein